MSIKNYISRKIRHRSSQHRWLVLCFCVFAMLMSPGIFAQIAQRGGATTGVSSGATVTINRPTGVVEGDIMIANIANYCRSGLFCELFCT